MTNPDIQKLIDAKFKRWCESALMLSLKENSPKSFKSLKPKLKRFIEKEFGVKDKSDNDS